MFFPKRIIIFAVFMFSAIIYIFSSFCLILSRSYFAWIAWFIGLFIGEFLNFLICYFLYLYAQDLIDTPLEILNRDGMEFVWRPRKQRIAGQEFYMFLMFFQRQIIFCFKCVDRFFYPSQTEFSRHYPFVVFGTAFLFSWTAFFVDDFIVFSAYLIFFSGLMILALIDFENLLLPDGFTKPLICAGLFINFFSLITPFSSALVGVIIGYLSLYLIGLLYKPFFTEEAIGAGDFKLLASIGAWLGWRCIPFIIFFGASLGLVIGLFSVFQGKTRLCDPQPFGTYLILAVYAFIIFDWGSFLFLFLSY